MLGLFERTYDYYEWDNLWAVSESKEKLIEKYKSLKTKHVLIENKDYEQMENNETCHFAIVEVECIV